MVRRCWVSFQCRGGLLNWEIAGQEPIAIAVGADGDCLDIFFSHLPFFSVFFLPFWDTA